MDKEQLLAELNMILFYEHGHLSLYEGQRKIVEDENISNVFDRFKHLEEEHAEKVLWVFKELGAKPSNLYKVSDFLGEVAGITSKLAGVKNILKADLAVEKKAIEGYQKLIAQIKDDRIADRLRENMIDAGLMYLWLKDQLGEYDPTTEIPEI
ncbi:MAG: demethoxyubiquinone hydroxylase family protein [Eubacteriales bacterium]